MAETKPQFANFGEAFCAYYRVRPEKYESAVLWRSLPWSRRFLALPILVFNRTFFATDFDIIRNLKPIQSIEEFGLQLDELYAVNRVERNIRRGFFGIRASGSRLMNLWKIVEPYITPPAPFNEGLVPAAASLKSRAPAIAATTGSSAGETPRTSPAIARRVGRSSTGLPAGSEASATGESRETLGAIETTPVVLRRLQRACDDTARGIPMEEAVSKSGLESVPQFLRLLAVNAATNPSFRWLHEQLREGERRRQLENELASLRNELAEQTKELARLRANLRA